MTIETDPAAAPVPEARAPSGPEVRTTSDPGGLVLRPLDLAVAAIGAGLVFVLLPPFDACAAALFWILAVVVVRSDLDRFLIPDEASLALAAAGLAHAALGAPDGAIEALGVAALQGAAAFAVFYAIRTGYRAWRGHDGLGFGDVKLAGALGVWLDIAAQAAALQVAAVAALAVVAAGRLAGRTAAGTAVPFGAFLAPAACLVFVAVRLVPDWRGSWP